MDIITQSLVSVIFIIIPRLLALFLGQEVAIAPRCRTIEGRSALIAGIGRIASSLGSFIHHFLSLFHVAIFHRFKIFIILQRKFLSIFLGSFRRIIYLCSRQVDRRVGKGTDLFLIGRQYEELPVLTVSLLLYFFQSSFVNEVPMYDFHIIFIRIYL